MQLAGTRDSGRHRVRLHNAVLFFLATFLLIFPKGGIKLAGIPVTWGYVGLGLFFAGALPFALLSGRLWRVRRARLLTLAALLPFQGVSLIAFAVNGVSGPGFTISFLVTFFFLPVVFVLLMGPYLDRIDAGLLFRFLRFGVLAVACYGIFLFVFRLSTGTFLEIPFLTMNIGDLGTLDEKYIDRGGIFKLISTYNNGNIYGISILMLLPLYGWLERSRLRSGIVKLSLVLTLSRTVWIGLVLYELLARLFIKRVSVREMLSLVGILGAVAIGIVMILEWLGVGVSFLLDRNLGGRSGQLQFLRDTMFFSTARFTEIFEIVYVSILHNFGILGLVCFLLGMTMPLFLFLTGHLPFARTEFKRSVAVGLAIYLVLAASDGAILYIPVMAFYWFLVSLLLSHNPTLPQGIVVRSPADIEVPEPLRAVSVRRGQRLPVGSSS